MLLRPIPVHKGSRPSAPYCINRASPHAVALAAWYPMDSGSGIVTREEIRNSFGLVEQRPSPDTDPATSSEFSMVKKFVSTGSRGGSLDSNFTAMPNASLVSASCWVYIPDASRKGCFFKVGGGTSGWGFGVGATQTSNFGNNLVGLYEFIRFIPTGVAIGTGWHQLGMVIDGSGFPTLYLDGRNVYSDSTGAPSAPSAGLFLPYDSNNGEHCDGCYMAELRLWNRRLTDMEMFQQWEPSTRWDLYWVGSSRTIVDGVTTVTDNQDWFPSVAVPRQRTNISVMY